MESTRYPAMVNQNHLIHFFGTTNKTNNNNKSNYFQIWECFKILLNFEKGLMITHVTNKVTINWKLRKYNKLFKPFYKIKI